MKHLPWVCLLSLAAASCTGSTKLPESPLSPCVVSATVSGNSFGPEGASATATVTTRTGCSWSVTADSWIMPAVTSGDGARTFAVTIAPNADGTSRTGAVVVGAQRLELAQSACAVKLTSDVEEFDERGGVRSVSVDTTSACRWAVEALEPWVKVEPPAGTGPTTLRIQVAENNSAALRTATVRVNGPTLTVRQGPEPVQPRNPTPSVDCEYRVSPVEAIISPLGGAGAVDITAPAGCGWTASVATSQVSLSTTSGTGSARLDYRVEKSTRTQSDTDRYAIAIRWPTPTAGQNVWLTQLPNCNTAFAIPGSSGFVTAVSAPATGGTTRLFVLVESPFRCPWTAGTDAQWITVTNPTGVQVGDGDLVFSVPANDTGRERFAYIAAGEKFLTVIQPAR